MAQNISPYSANEEYLEDQEFQNPAPIFEGHWKASLNPAAAQEGVTPYLHQQEFDKALTVLNDDDDDVDTELIFNSTQDAYNWRSRLRTFNIQAANDPTIPRTLKQKKGAVKLVFKAFKSAALATDNAGMMKAFQEQKHDNRQVETICWSIVEGCIDRCDRGPLLNAYEPEKAKQTLSIRTFAERLDAVVESLSRQKTICKHLLDAPYLNRFLDDPVGSKHRVESNRKLNKRKGGVMDVGKKALGMTGRKGRPPGDKKSNEGSDDEGDEFGSESQEYRGGSSGISSPFRTPDQQMIQTDIYGTPPRIGSHVIRSASRFRNETTTPPSRKRRAGTAATSSPLGPQTLLSPYDQQYGNTAGANLNGSLGSHPPPMGMLPGSMMDTGPSYPTNYTYGSMMGQTRGLMDPFHSPPVRTVLPFDLIQTNLQQKQSYAAQMNSNYPNPYATSPTSAPFLLSDEFREPEADATTKSSPSSNESNGSDDEYLPGRNRKRGRQH
jgi:hypothetical protein